MLLEVLESLAGVLILALIHLYAKALRLLANQTRNAILSACAGASIGYVMMLILPKLAEKQDKLVASIDTGVRGFFQHHVYLLALTGLVLYYAITRLANQGSSPSAHLNTTHQRIVMHTTFQAYAAYSFLMGYLCATRYQMGLASLVLITLGLGPVFLINDYGLYKKWPDAYQRWGQQYLVVILLAGWALGVYMDVSDNIIALWYSFLAGIILITTIREKLRVEERSPFWSFFGGVLLFTMVVLAFEYIG